MPNRDGTGPRCGRGMGRGRGGMRGGAGFGGMGPGGRGHGGAAALPDRAGAPAVAAPGSLVAVSARGEGLDSAVDARFGRAEGFVLTDADGKARGYVPNREARDLPQGAGLAAAEAVVRAGAGTVVTGQVGPKAAAALAAAGVRVVEGMDGLTVAEALSRIPPA